MGQRNETDDITQIRWLMTWEIKTDIRSCLQCYVSLQPADSIFRSLQICKNTNGPFNLFFNSSYRLNTSSLFIMTTMTEIQPEQIRPCTCKCFYDLFS